MSPDSTDSPGGRRIALLAVIAVVVVILDLVTKIIVVDNLVEGGPSPRILGGLVYFSLLRNPGAAFGIATGMTWVLTLIVIAVVIAIIRLATRLRSTAWAIALGLVLGGALGNLIDRLFRSPGFMRGHVVDFISVFGPNAEYFPAFNVADSGVTVGGVMLVITVLLGIDFDGRRGRPGKSPAAEENSDGHPSDAADQGEQRG